MTSPADITFRLRRAAMVDTRLATAFSESCNSRTWQMGEWHLRLALGSKTLVRVIRGRKR